MSGMTGLEIILEGDGAFEDLKEKGFVTGQLVTVAALPNGTAKGRPVVGFRIELPDGSTVVATSDTLYRFAA